MKSLNFKEFKILVKKEFQFLINQYNYKIIEEEEGYTTYAVHYSNETGGRRVFLKFDYRENRIFSRIINGKDTEFSEFESENVKSFYSLFLNNEPTTDLGALVHTSSDMSKALKNNALLLKKYGKDILEGNKWDFPTEEEVDKDLTIKAKGYFELGKKIQLSNHLKNIKD